MRVLISVLSAVALLYVFGNPTGAFAAEPRAIEEILITAQKREESLMDVPQSVQAFDQAFIEGNNVRDLVDAVNFIPGASASFSGGAGSQLYNLRGTGAQGRIGQIAIGFYIDDIPGSAAERLVRRSVFSISNRSKCCAVRKARCTARARWAAHSS